MRDREARFPHGIEDIRSAGLGGVGDIRSNARNSTDGEFVRRIAYPGTNPAHLKISENESRNKSSSADGVSGASAAATSVSDEDFSRRNRTAGADACLAKNRVSGRTRRDHPRDSGRAAVFQALRFFDAESAGPTLDEMPKPNRAIPKIPTITRIYEKMGIVFFFHAI